MPEQQNIEYKQSWHDDYQTGFAVLPTCLPAGKCIGWRNIYWQRR